MYIVVDYASKGGVSKVALKQALLLKASLVILSKYRPWSGLCINSREKRINGGVYRVDTTSSGRRMRSMPAI